MVEFLDLHIIPKIDDEASYEQMAQLLALSGYHAVGVTVPTGLMRDRLEAVRDRFRASGLDIFLRADLTCSRREELLKLLRRFRPAFDLIGVRCTNHSLALVAARDRRVDLIFFDHSKRNVWLDDSIANVSNASLELNMRLLLECQDLVSLTRLRKEIAIAHRHNMDIVLSSGGTSPYTVRAPIQLMAIGEILGLTRQDALQSVSTVPLCIVTKNSHRRSSNYIEEGVSTPAEGE